MNIPSNLTHCLSTSCNEAGCGCPVSGLKVQVDILDMNCVKATVKKRGRICDCGILWKAQPTFAVVELKGGRAGPKLNQLVEQLQGGLRILEEQLDGQTVEDFYPILLYRSKRDPTAALQNKRVKFRGITHNVIARPCGTDLGNIIGMSGSGGVKRRRRAKRLGSRK